MNTTLRTLVELQKIDSIILDLQQKIGEFPNLMQRLEKLLTDHESNLTAMRARLEEQEKTRRTRESEVEERIEKLRKYQSQLLEVKTNKEYAALLAEIKGVKTKNSLAEDDILELMESIERAKNAIRETQREVEQEQERTRQVKQQKEAEQAVLQQSLAQEEAKRHRIAVTVEEKMLKEYARLLQLRNGVAAAGVEEEGVCSGCRVALTPQMFAEVKSGEYLHRCPTCFRFLYWTGNSFSNEPET